MLRAALNKRSTTQTKMKIVKAANLSAARFLIFFARGHAYGLANTRAIFFFKFINLRVAGRILTFELEVFSLEIEVEQLQL